MFNGLVVDEFCTRMRGGSNYDCFFFYFLLAVGLLAQRQKRTRE